MAATCCLLHQIEEDFPKTISSSSIDESLEDEDDLVVDLGFEHDFEDDTHSAKSYPYEFSYANLCEILQEIGCTPWASLTYLRPGHTIQDGLFEISNDTDMTEMFILYEGEVKEIELFITHPDVEESDDEELGWHQWEEIGGEQLELGGDKFGNGNNGAGSGADSVAMDYLEEGGPSAKAMEDKGRGKSVIVGEDVEGGDSDKDRDRDSDIDYACSGLWDSSSSDGDGEEIYDFEEGGLSVKVVKDIGKSVILVRMWKESVVVTVVMTLGVLSAHQMVRRFLDHFKEFHLRNGSEYKYIKNESKRVTVKCKYEDEEHPCTWRLHASRVGVVTRSRASGSGIGTTSAGRGIQVSTDGGVVARGRGVISDAGRGMAKGSGLVGGGRRIARGRGMARERGMAIGGRSGFGRGGGATSDERGFARVGRGIARGATERTIGGSKKNTSGSIGRATCSSIGVATTGAISDATTVSKVPVVDLKMIGRLPELEMVFSHLKSPWDPLRD
ncbi:hypothetical protein C3L33_09146, partial [Rhododendron williamsianum]